MVATVVGDLWNFEPRHEEARVLMDGIRDRVLDLVSGYVEHVLTVFASNERLNLTQFIAMNREEYQRTLILRAQETELPLFLPFVFKVASAVWPMLSDRSLAKDDPVFETFALGLVPQSDDWCTFAVRFEGCVFDQILAVAREAHADSQIMTAREMTRQVTARIFADAKDRPHSAGFGLVLSTIDFLIDRYAEFDYTPTT